LQLEHRNADSVATQEGSAYKRPVVLAVSSPSAFRTYYNMFKRSIINIIPQFYRTVSIFPQNVSLRNLCQKGPSMTGPASHYVLAFARALPYNLVEVDFSAAPLRNCVLSDGHDTRDVRVLACRLPTVSRCLMKNKNRQSLTYSISDASSATRTITSLTGANGEEPRSYW
jgi:hypothetical protein